MPFGHTSRRTTCKTRLTVSEYTPMLCYDLYVCIVQLIALSYSHPVQIFGGDVIPFNLLPELANRYLAPTNPVVIHYTINPSVPPPERPSAWDIELKLEDVALKSKMQAVTLNASRDTLRELTKLDDEVRPGTMFSFVL